MSILRSSQRPSSPNPFSQIWEKGDKNPDSPLPSLGEGLGVRASGSRGSYLIFGSALM